MRLTARSKSFHLCCGAIALAHAASIHAAVDFESGIKPIIEAACLRCHNEANPEGGLRLDTFEAAIADDVHCASHLARRTRVEPLLRAYRLTGRRRAQNAA